MLGVVTINWMSVRPQPEPGYAWIFVGYTLATVVLTVAVSTLTYRWIERPGIAAGRRALALVSGDPGDAGEAGSAKKRAGRGPSEAERPCGRG